MISSKGASGKVGRTHPEGLRAPKEDKPQGQALRRAQDTIVQSGLGNLTPAAYAVRSAPDTQRDGALRYTEGSAFDSLSLPPSTRSAR
jgi:hypothetical protein